jgi:hypothetical protein
MNKNYNQKINPIELISNLTTLFQNKNNKAIIKNPKNR